MILDDIVSYKKKSLENAKKSMPLRLLEKSAGMANVPRGFGRALREHKHIALIAEVKRASPSAGVIRNNVVPEDIAYTYEASGAAAISVLTDERFFKGSMSDLVAVKEAVSVPVFRKDFILDPWQVYEARAHGADGILLIASILEDEKLKSLLTLCHKLSIDALVEVHTENELSRALDLGAEIIGINNRDLKTFHVDLATTIRLVSRIPRGIISVSESGIRDREDVTMLHDAGVNAILVGTALMQSHDIAVKIRALLGAESG